MKNKKMNNIGLVENKNKLLFILGTHRSGGNSELIEKLMSSNSNANKYDIEYVYLKDYIIKECQSCYKCSEVGRCCIDDDVSMIVKKMISSDVIIFVPVVYGFGTGAIFQKFIERAGYGFLRGFGRPLRDKIAGITVIGRRYAHESVVQQLFMNIMLNEMVLYGSGFLPILNGVTFPGNIMNDLEGIEAFNKMIDRITDVIRQQEGGAIINAYEKRSVLNNGKNIIDR